MTPLEAILKSLAMTGAVGTLVFAVLAIRSNYTPKEDRKSEEESDRIKERLLYGKVKQLYLNFGDDENGQFFFNFMKDYV